MDYRRIGVHPYEAVFELRKPYSVREFLAQHWKRGDSGVGAPSVSQVEQHRSKVDRCINSHQEVIELAGPGPTGAGVGAEPYEAHAPIEVSGSAQWAVVRFFKILFD